MRKGNHFSVRIMLLVSLVAGSAAVAEGDSREQLHAILWAQTSAEYQVLMRQTWALATEKLHTSTGPGSAAYEQFDMPSEKLASMPTAVIVDVDETVLDNSAFQARMVRERKEYSDANWSAWDAWVRGAAAPATPGAREFFDEATRLGHRVFYVTNRECPRQAPPPGSDPCPQKTATQRNLMALGLPGASDPSNLLLRRERPEWDSSDKSGRRAWVAERYRIIEMVGDDLRDFVERPVFEGRRAQLAAMFGTRWFMMPNAMYGSWEKSLVEGACLAAADADECSRLKLQRKYDRLQTEPAVGDLPLTPLWDGRRDRVRIATWNVEYLMEPATFAALQGPNCSRDNSKVAGSQRQIPCDIIPAGDRKPADFAALRRYALQLDPDVIALEETDGPAAARQLFPGYDFCFSSRANLQKNGIGVRRGLPFRCDGEYLPVSMNDAERRGVLVTLFPGTANEMALMGVHLRSGCPEGPLSDEANARCPRLAAQVPQLKAWIDAQLAAGTRFVVLGDFNRRLTKEPKQARDADGRLVNVWAELNGSGRDVRGLVNLAAIAPFTKCIPGDEFDSYIDTLVIGPKLASQMIPKSFQRVTFSAADAKQFRLSDHCPVGVEFRLH